VGREQQKRPGNGVKAYYSWITSSPMAAGSSLLPAAERGVYPAMNRGQSGASRYLLLPALTRKKPSLLIASAMGS
jgi:hypothetical protein